MQAGRTTWLAGVAATIVAVALLATMPAYASVFDEPWDEPASVEKVAWSLVSIDGPHTITYGVSTGYCVGKKMPRLLPPRVAWRAGRVVITMRIFHPALHFASHEACGGIGLGMTKQLRLVHSIAGRTLFDGSTSPPQRRGEHRADPTG